MSKDLNKIYWKQWGIPESSSGLQMEARRPWLKSGLIYSIFYNWALLTCILICAIKITTLFTLFHLFHLQQLKRNWGYVMVLAVNFLHRGFCDSCFGFLMKIVVITQDSFSCCRAIITKSQGLFCLSCSPTSKEAGGAEEAGTADSSWLKVCPTPHGITLNNKSWSKEGGKGTFTATVFVFPRNVCDEPGFPGSVWTFARLLEATNELFVSFCLCAFFALNVFISTHDNFYSPDSLFHLRWGQLASGLGKS